MLHIAKSTEQEVALIALYGSAFKASQETSSGVFSDISAAPLEDRESGLGEIQNSLYDTMDAVDRLKTSCHEECRESG